jgi:ABC-2 type transport system ATP-binding protein
VTEEKGLYPYMTVAQIIYFTRSFFPKWRHDLERRYLTVFDLPPNRKIADLSKGMRSQLMLLLAISHGADLLILDEPTEGMDAVAVEVMLRELVAISAAEGTTIFFSSHQLEEVEQIADRVCLIDQGVAMLTGVLDDIKTDYQRLRIVFGEAPGTHVQWGEGVERIRHDGRTVEILASRNIDGIVNQARSWPGASVERSAVTLKDIFLALTRRP